MVVKISNAEVHIIDKFTWGQREDLVKEMSRGIKVNEMGLKEIDAGPTMDSKYKLLELAVTKIVDDKGVETQYSKEWAYNLEVEDGDKLFKEIDELSGGLFGNKKKI